MTPEPSSAALPHGHVPSPPSERRAWILACSLALLGIGFMAAVLSGAVGRSAGQTPAPPVLVRAVTPQAGASAAPVTQSVASASIVARPSVAQQSLDARRFTGATAIPISRGWMAGFYPIYATAQSTFGVYWLLLASIHMQESAFSTAPGIYHGLNFAHCCGGPMQFNVTNGPLSTWDLVAGSYVYGRRPASYNHMTATHPSIYDDFDSIMAAAHLLSADGAGYPLDGAAWSAAYSYYGHDATGVLYADQVLARAIGWSQHGFCINCAVSPPLLAAVHAAYGAPVAAALEARPPVVAKVAGSRRRRSTGG